MTTSFQKTLSFVADSLWESVESFFKDAVVFLDKGSAEFLHWQGGLEYILNCGAVSVKEFSSFESDAEDQHKAVFVITSTIWRISLDILRDIIKGNKFHQCIVITSVNNDVLNLAKYGLRENAVNDEFAQLEKQMLVWMGSLKYESKVIHLPLLHVIICQNLFLTPSFYHLFPLLACDVDKIKERMNEKLIKFEKRNINSLDDVDFSCLPLELQVPILHFISNFNSLIEELDCKVDCFSIGHTSKIIGNEFENYINSKNRKKQASKKISVIFVDRTLDLVEPSSHKVESLLDRIFLMLPKFPDVASDVAIDMSCFSSSPLKKDELPLIAPGCLAHKDKAASLFNSLVYANPKEGIIEMNRCLVEAAVRQGINLNMNRKAARITVDTLLSRIEMFKNNWKAIGNESSLLQFALAIYQAEKHISKFQAENMLSVEKVLAQNINLKEENYNSLFSQMCEVFKQAKSRSMKTEDAFVILLHMYSLLGDGLLNFTEEEDKLKNIAWETVLQNYNELSDCLKKLIGTEVDELGVHIAVENIFEKLKAVAEERSKLRKFRYLINENDESCQPIVYNPFLKQVVEHLCSPNANDMQDFEFHSSGLREKLKSGLGRFINISKPKIADNSIVILFIIGGVTTRELRLIKETSLTLKSDMQILVGSTRILAPNSTFEALLDDVYK